MSPRAARRLEALGYTPVYHYVVGKADWLAVGLPTEGDGPSPHRVAEVMDRAVTTCRPNEEVSEVAGLAEVGFGAAKDRPGLVAVITLGTGIGSALFVDGTLVPNTELGHLPMRHKEAEDWAAESLREHDDLSWKKWASRLQRYLELVEKVLWPQLFVVGGGVSKKADKFLPHIKIGTEIVTVQLHNDVGIVGAALLAPAAGRAATRSWPSGGAHPEPRS